MDEQQTPPAEREQQTTKTPRLTGECSFGMHKHCANHVRYDGSTGWVEWMPCDCSCHTPPKDTKVERQARIERVKQDLMWAIEQTQRDIRALEEYLAEHKQQPKAGEE